MWNETLSYFVSFYSLVYQAIVPCPLPEQLLANTIDQQQYLGKWYFKAAVSHREADIQSFKVMDSMWFTMEETAKDTLLLTGHMHIGDTCGTETWTYHVRPDRDDLVLEGRTKRRSLLWSGKWVNCPECIILQEVEPPLSPADSEDSLSRFMLYSRQNDVSSEVVTAFLKNAACNNMQQTVTPPQKKELCS